MIDDPAQPDGADAPAHAEGADAPERVDGAVRDLGTLEPIADRDVPPTDALHAWSIGRGSRKGAIGVALALLAVAVVVSVNGYLLQEKARAARSEATPSGSAHASLDVRALSQHFRMAVPSSFAPPSLEKSDENGPTLEENAPDDAPPKKKGESGARRGETVQQAAARSCSTSSVDGLSRQIIAQARCNDADAFAPMPSRPNLETGGHIFLYLEVHARDRLLKVLKDHPDRTMKVHSALRTVAQQYLLSRWSNGKKCGIQLATPPGESNHETGLALDIGSPGDWRPALEEQGFKWLGAIDRVHFDFKGAGAASHEGLDVLAFQQLWNKNHPDDTIPESGHYGAPTEIRLKKSPASGFPQGAQCGAGRGASGRSAHVHAH